VNNALDVKNYPGAKRKKLSNTNSENAYYRIDEKNDNQYYNKGVNK